jgi:hypothetical protein
MAERRLALDRQLSPGRRLASVDKRGGARPRTGYWTIAPTTRADSPTNDETDSTSVRRPPAPSPGAGCNPGTAEYAESTLDGIIEPKRRTSPGRAEV